MKILHVVSSLNQNAGGISEVVPRICEEMAALGEDVRIVTCRSKSYSEATTQALAHGVKITFAELNQCRFGLAFSWDFKRQIERAVAEADIVHVNGIWQAPSWIAMRKARKLGIPFVVQPHGFLEPERLKFSSFKKRLSAAFFERPGLRRCAAAIATSESEAQSIRAFGFSGKIGVVPIGIDVSPFEHAVRDESLLKRLGADPAKKTLLYFSRITPIKGLDMLGEAWASLSDLHGEWQLLIAGPDDRSYTEGLRRLYRKLVSDESYVFCGPVYGADKYTLFRSVDAFVLPTRSENFGIVVPEAMAAGLPTVCTKGAPWELIERYGAGAWVDIAPSAIAAGLRTVLSAGKDELSKMSSAARRLVAENFQWPAIARKQIEIYKECI